MQFGGGTGWNIEQIGKYLNVPLFFHAVYLVDLCPSLLKIAQARFKNLGWSNVKLVCIDCRDFTLEEYDSPCDKESKDTKGADLITMSYSLSMIPEFYAVIDSAVSLLSTNGIIAVVDFYTQSQVEFQGRSYVGGFVNRHCTWLNRTFWRAWFDLDRVWLGAGRRDYLEYRFGTRLSINLRNAMLPGLRIPFYIWIGCSKDYPSNDLDIRQEQLNLRRLHLPLPSFWYQTHGWRVYYDDRLERFKQFNNGHISTFSSDDSQSDARILSIRSTDVILAPTDTGDNILSFALQKPKFIYAVDPSPLQNHLLELKVAAFRALGYDDVWILLGEGRAANFRTLLIDKLSPHLSSHAFQYWLRHGPQIFARQGLFHSRYSRHALNLASGPLFFASSRIAPKRLAEARTLEEQVDIWDRSIRKMVLNRSFYGAVVGNKQWPWSISQGQISGDSSSLEAHIPWDYVVNTLDPVIRSTLLSEDNHYYLLGLLRRYTPRCHPDHLQPSSHTELSKAHAFDGLRIYTDEMSHIIAQISPRTLTIAVVMDGMDMFYPQSVEADTQIRALNTALAMSGRVLLKSVRLQPWYISKFEQLGFHAKCHGSRELGVCIDR